MWKAKPMDPTANLSEQVGLAATMLDKDSEHIDTGDALRLAELVIALHEWMLAGGFLPVQWRPR
jgi:hypothetical protein